MQNSRGRSGSSIFGFFKAKARLLLPRLQICNSKKAFIYQYVRARYNAWSYTIFNFLNAALTPHQRI